MIVRSPLSKPNSIASPQTQSDRPYSKPNPIALFPQNAIAPPQTQCDRAEVTISVGEVARRLRHEFLH
jgi:hypothetical protein